MTKQELLRSLPKIDKISQDERLASFVAKSPDTVHDAARRYIEEIRQAVLNDKTMAVPDYDSIISHIITILNSSNQSKLAPVVNATGVVLHTNFGRSPLGKTMLEEAGRICAGYSNLEYDLETGKRADRTSYIEQMICELTGAQDALVVNNNVAALSMCLNSLSLNKSVILSRGEMVEIGGSFRLPEIIEATGCKLCEIGTTNVSRLTDYEKAISHDTGAILKVNPSNFSFIGYSEEVSLRDISHLADKHNTPFIFDMGSGVLFSLERFGIDDMTVEKALESGADIVTFSCDKLLGGPQAGIIAGKKKYIDIIRRNPLMRAVRVDKFTLSTLQVTLDSYLSYARAKEEIPVLSIFNMTQDQLKTKAEELKSKVESCLDPAIKKRVDDGHIIKIEPVEDTPGGGCAPSCRLAGYGLTLGVSSPEEVCAQLRRGSTPIIAYVRNDKVILSVRTIMDGQEKLVARAVASILNASLCGESHA